MSEGGSVWSKRGEKVVGAAADLVGGLGRGFGQLGKRVRRGQYKAFAEGLCAVAGDVASRNGRLKPEELAGFRAFLLENRDNPAVRFFEADALTEKFRDYAIKAFLCDEPAFVQVIDQVKQSSKGGKELSDLILIGALAIAFADGECDAGKRAAIEDYAARLEVDLADLATSLGVLLPPPGTVALPAPAQEQSGEPEVIDATSSPALVAGGNVALASQRTAEVSLSWSPDRIGGHEIDVAAFLLSRSGKVRSDQDFIFYNQPRSPDGAVVLSGTGPHRTFTIDLSGISADIVSVAFAVTVDAGATFAAAERVRLEVGGTASFEPDLASCSQSALILGQLSRKSGSWKLRAVGQGFAGGLGPLAAHFGVDVG